jgi:Domain of unknown function (DUF4157)
MTGASAKGSQPMRHCHGVRTREEAKHQGQAPSAAAPLLALQSLAGNRATSDLVGAGVELPADVRADMELRFGQDFSTVHVHDDTSAHASARSFAAKAYTHGEDIVFADGRFAPETQQGRHLLAHELAHVVQQRRGGGEPPDDARAPTERVAASAADAVTAGSGPVAVGGATGVGVACDKDEEEEDKRKGQASATVLAQPPPRRGVREKGVDVGRKKNSKKKKNYNKARGTLGEVTVPFDRYSGPEWSHIGGGSETESSRTSLARRSYHDIARGQEATAGIDFIVEHTKTGRLVIGEQKATKSPEFTKPSAITTSLEDNLAHTVETLREQIKSGKVHPDAVPGLESTIARLEATRTALANRTELPPGVVFELTNVGGEGERISKKGYLDLLVKKYGDTPAFVEHLLSRTFVRDPKLAKAKGRDPSQKGTDADPDIVPALELLGDKAEKELARLKSGKSKAEWNKQQAKEKAAQKKQKAEESADEAKGRKEQKKQETADRNAAKKKTKDDAAKTGEEARLARLEELKKQRKRSGALEPTTKGAQKKRDAADRKDAKAVGEAAKQKQLVDAQAEADRQKLLDDAKKKADEDAREEVKGKKKAEDDEARAKQEAHTKELADARKQVEGMGEMTPEQWEALPKEQRQKLEKLAANDPALAARLHEKVNAKQTRDFDTWAKQHNTDVETRNKGKSRDEKMSAAAHRLNQAAAGVRALDAFLDARKNNKGYAEALFDAGKTYLDNTNQVMGGINTFRERLKTEKLPNGKEQQYYGNDAGDAFFGTLGENIANYVVPGEGWDQLVNGAANLIDAGDDHLNRGKPVDPTKATVRTGTDLLAELTPSRMFSTTIGAGARAFWDLERAKQGDMTGVDKFGEDSVRGKLGSIIQPWAMGADFLGNLGNNDAGTALDKTLEKSKETTLAKIGNWGGASAADLGENKEAKQGKYGFSVQTTAAFLGFTNALAREEGLSRALDETVESTKGTLLGDVTGAAVSEGRELYKEGGELAAKGKEMVKDEYESKKKFVTTLLGL